MFVPRFAKFATLGRFNCVAVGSGIAGPIVPLKLLVVCIESGVVLQIFLQLEKRISTQPSPTATALCSVLLRCTCRLTVQVYSAATPTITISVAKTEMTTTSELPDCLRGYIVFIVFIGRW